MYLTSLGHTHIAVRSLLLNMEVVTQFDPGVSKQLEDAKMECERCASSIKEVVEGEMDPSETEP